VIGHHNHRMKLELFPVIVQTVLEYGVQSLRRERGSIPFAKCDEQRSSSFLIVRQLPPVLILPVESSVGRTLLSAAVAFDLALDVHNDYCTANRPPMSVTDEQLNLQNQTQRRRTEPALSLPKGVSAPHNQLCRGHTAQRTKSSLLRQITGTSFQPRAFSEQASRHQASRYLSNFDLPLP